MNKQLEQLLHKQLTRKEFLHVSAVLVISMFAGLGVLTELLSRAATPSSSEEAEKGTLAGGAQIINDSTASGGEAVRFGAATVWQPLGEVSVGGDIVSLSINPYDSHVILVAGDQLGLGLSADGGDSWQATTGLPSYQMAESTWISADTVWCASMSGPVLSTDGGAIWTSMRSGMPAVSSNSDTYYAATQKILQDPTNSSRLLAFFGSKRGWANYASPNNYGQVWASTNNGKSWSLLSTISTSTNITSATYTSDNSAILATLSGTKGGVFRSTDGGNTWTAINNGLPTWNYAHHVVSDPNNANTAWAGYYNNGTGSSSGGIWKTTNVLAATPTWTLSSSGITTYYCAISQLAISPDGKTLITGNIYFANDGVSTTHTYRSTDGGDSWTDITSNASGVQALSNSFAAYTAFDPNNSSTLIIGNEDSILKSTDGGDSWTDAANVHVSSRKWSGKGFAGYLNSHITFGKQSGNILLSGWDSAISIMSNDNGNTWIMPNRNVQGSHLPANGTQFGGGYSSCFGGPNDQCIYVNTGQGYVFDGILYSQNGGTTMTYVAPGTNGLGPSSSGSNQDFNDIICASADGQTVLVALHAGIYRSTDGGASWTKTISLSYACAIAVDPSNYNTVYISSINKTNSVYVSTDNGLTATQLTSSPNNVCSLHIDPNNTQTVYATGWLSSHPAVSNDGGTTWTQLSGLPTNCSHVVVDPTNSNRLAASTYAYPSDVCEASGVYVSTNKGSTWTQTNTGLAMLSVMGLAFDPYHSGRLICGTYGRGSHEIQL